MQINRLGRVIGGVGESGVWLSGQTSPIIPPPAGNCGWWDDDAFVYQDAGQLRGHNLSGVGGMLDAGRVTLTRGAAGYYAVYVADPRGVEDSGVRLSWGPKLKDAKGLLGVADDGTVFVISHDYRNIEAYAPNSTAPLWVETQAYPVVYDQNPQFCALDAQRCAWWNAATKQIQTRGFGGATIQTQGTPFDLFILELNGERLVGYHNDRLFVHPWSDPSRGYIIDGLTFDTVGRAVNGRVRVAFSRNPGEAGIEVVDIDLTSPRVALAPSAPPPPVVTPPATPPSMPPVTPPAPPTSPAPIDQGTQHMRVHTIALKECELVASPAGLADWRVTARIRQIRFTRHGIGVTFDQQSTWPPFIPIGTDEHTGAPKPWDGPLQYSVGLARKVNGRWVAGPVFHYWPGLPEYGDNMNNEGGRQLAKNLLYSEPWYGPMAGWVPAEGEQVGFFVASCETPSHDPAPARREVMERSDVVLVPWTYNFTTYDLEYAGAPPATPPATTPPATPPETPPSTPPGSSAPPATPALVDLAALGQILDDKLSAAVASVVANQERLIADLRGEVKALREQVAKMTPPKYSGEVATRFFGTVRVTLTPEPPR